MQGVGLERVPPLGRSRSPARPEQAQQIQIRRAQKRPASAPPPPARRSPRQASWAPPVEGPELALAGVAQVPQQHWP